MIRVFLFIIALCAFALFPTAAHSLDDYEIAALIQTGIHEDDIIRMMENQGSEASLANDSVQKLRRAGASDKLVDRLLALTESGSGR